MTRRTLTHQEAIFKRMGINPEGPHRCSFCEEMIDAKDDVEPFGMGVVMNQKTQQMQPVAIWMHHACKFRVQVGSVGHLTGKCHCPGSTGEMDDPPNMTPRAAAEAALALYLERKNANGLTN